MIPVVSRGARLVTQHPHLMANYGRLALNIVRGEGCWLYDESGNAYLDMVAGIAVCALGHAHPRITRAIAEQAATLVHVSNLVHHEPAGTLADRLAELSGFDTVFFCNSGTEANEAAIKLARKTAFRKGQPERNVILAAKGSFHGRTFGSLAATDSAKYQEGYAPLPGGFAHVPYNDIEALDAAIDETTACFLVEPIQGESGILPATVEYLQAARRLCDERGALLIFDDIQTGMGRLGRLFAHQFYGVTPDAFTLAKSLANGLDRRAGCARRARDHAAPGRPRHDLRRLVRPRGGRARALGDSRRARPRRARDPRRRPAARRTARDRERERRGVRAAARRGPDAGSAGARAVQGRRFRAARSRPRHLHQRRRPQHAALRPPAHHQRRRDPATPPRRRARPSPQRCAPRARKPKPSFSSGRRWPMESEYACSVG